MTHQSIFTNHKHNILFAAVLLATVVALLLAVSSADAAGTATVQPLARRFQPTPDAPGNADSTFNPSVENGDVLTMVQQTDGKIIVGGAFASVNGVSRVSLVRLNADGSVDAGFLGTVSSDVYSIAVQPDGKILLGGIFFSVNGTPRSCIARLNGDGSLDSAFAPQTNNTSVRSLALQADGKIVLAGTFNSLNGAPRNFIARVNGDGSLDSGFDPNANAEVDTVALQVDGKILIAGPFTSVGGAMRSGIARLNADGTLDSSFAPIVDGAVNNIAVEADGKILVGGSFTSVSGITHNRLARLQSDGSLDAAFNPNFDDTVYSIALQANGKILVGGAFFAINGTPFGSLTQLNHDGTINTAFVASIDGLVLCVGLQTNGQVLVGGNFGLVDNVSHHRLARVQNTAAGQALSVVGASTVQWLRGGAAPELERVTVELSTNNGASWTSLGAAARTAVGWNLGGLSLPPNGLLRARGRSVGSFFSGGSGLHEQVSHFSVALSPAGIVSRKVHGSAAFDIDLATTGTPKVECRSGSASGNYTLVFTFANTLTTINAAQVVVGSGSVSSSSIGADPHQYVVNLTGIANGQTIALNLVNVTDSLGNNSDAVAARMSVLVGDTTGNGSVTASDIGQTKSRSGLATDSTNFRSDVNASGSINASDIGFVKSLAGTLLP